jgi:hypothetical protein
VGTLDGVRLYVLLCQSVAGIRATRPRQHIWADEKPNLDRLYWRSWEGFGLCMVWVPEAEATERHAMSLVLPEPFGTDPLTHDREVEKDTTAVLKRVCGVERIELDSVEWLRPLLEQN